MLSMSPNNMEINTTVLVLPAASDPFFGAGGKITVLLVSMLTV